MSTTNLDLTRVSSEDLDTLASKINTFYKSDSSVKSELSWHWERNQLMLDGKQWLQFNGSNSPNGLWQKLSVSKVNEYIPRPVTNHLYDVYQTLKSYLIKNKPRSKVFPNDVNSFKDKLAARLATLVLEANYVRLKEQYNYETAAANLIAYGTVFKKSYWDTSALGIIKVPKMTLQVQTDPVTGAPTGQIEVQETDPVTGDPMTEDLPLGDLNTSVVEPQRMCLDPLAMHLHDARWVMEYCIQPLDWIIETYGKEGDGFTGLADKVQEDKDLNGSMQRWFQMRNTSGVKTGSSLGFKGSASGDTMIENAAVVKEYYERPSMTNPKGRLVVVAGDKTVYAGPSPYEGPELGDWHPYSECRWEIVPGRFWGKSPLDDACEIQKNINSIDSTIILTRKTSAIPQKLIPNTVGVSPGTWTGRPNQEIFYRPDPSGAKPENIPASGVDQSVFAERQQRVSDLREISGAIDILRGEKPPGADAASALSLLYEVGTGKLYPILDRWKMFVENDQKKQLKIIHKRYREPRPEFIRYLRSLNKDLADNEINTFIGTDLHDNCNVIVEAGSNIPKLQAARQARLMELAQLGQLNLQNPSNRIQFQQDMGISGYDSDIEPDRRRAEWENDLLDNLMHSPDNRPIVLNADNHDLHIEIHQTRQKSPSYMALPFEIQQAYEMHIQQHNQMKMMAMHAQMLQEQAMAPAPGSPPRQAPQGQPSASQGTPSGHNAKGLTKETKNAVFGADLNNVATLGTSR